MCIRDSYYSLKWSYDSNAPAPDAAEQANDRERFDWKIKPTDRQSLLPVPLLLDVDFWINLPVGMEFGDIGPAGALINATLWSCCLLYTSAGCRGLGRARRRGFGGAGLGRGRAGRGRLGRSGAGIGGS